MIRDHLGCHVFPVLDPSLAAASQRHKSESEVSVSADDEEIVVRRPSKGRKKTTQTAPKTTSVICNKLTQLFEGVQVRKEGKGNTKNKEANMIIE